jgi:hypothetical protein
MVGDSTTLHALVHRICYGSYLYQRYAILASPLQVLSPHTPALYWRTALHKGGRRYFIQWGSSLVSNLKDPLTTLDRVARLQWL